MKTIVDDQPISTNKIVPLGIIDQKGREIGLSVKIWGASVSEAPADYKGAYYLNLEPGDFIVVRMNPTRNGYTFGATQPIQFFKTAAEAEAAVEKRIKTTKARYAKKFS